jgi:hypothetical protein
MGFRDREKERLQKVKPDLFTAPACENGRYTKNGPPYTFCLNWEHSEENLEASIREAALEYFRERAIRWHDGRAKDGKQSAVPSTHLCCSQSACVNFLFPFATHPAALANVLRELGYDVGEMLPMQGDTPHLSDGASPFVSFEWIGEQNYLGEWLGGKVAESDKRPRGAMVTSADFACRFRQSSGQIHIILGEWKYTECYGNERSMRISTNGTDRLDNIYRPLLEADNCQIDTADIPLEALFYDPFDQLMREQLLATKMEEAREMDADLVSLLHIAPVANRELMRRITSPGLRGRGETIHEVWQSIVGEERFKGVYLEELLPKMSAHAPDQSWKQYMERRYGGMK